MDRSFFPMERLQAACRGMEFELRFLPQREGPTAIWIGQTDRGIQRWPNWASRVAPVTARQASTPNTLFLP